MVQVIQKEGSLKPLRDNIQRLQAAVLQNNQQKSAQQQKQALLKEQLKNQIKASIAKSMIEGTTRPTDPTADITQMILGDAPLDLGQFQPVSGLERTLGAAQAPAQVASPLGRTPGETSQVSTTTAGTGVSRETTPMTGNMTRDQILNNFSLESFNSNGMTFKRQKTEEEVIKEAEQNALAKSIEKQAVKETEQRVDRQTALDIVDQLELGFKEAFPDAPKRGAGRFAFGLKKSVEAAAQDDPNISSYLDTRSAFMSLLVRGLGEKGVLTNTDIKRVEKAIADQFDSKDTATKSFETIRKILNAGFKRYDREQNILKRDGQGKDLQEFSSVKEAEAAGLKKGTIILINGRRAEVY